MSRGRTQAVTARPGIRTVSTRSSARRGAGGPDGWTVAGRWRGPGPPTWRMRAGSDDQDGKATVRATSVAISRFIDNPRGAANRPRRCTPVKSSVGYRTVPTGRRGQPAPPPGRRPATRRTARRPGPGIRGRRHPCPGRSRGRRTGSAVRLRKGAVKVTEGSSGWMRIPTRYTHGATGHDLPLSSEGFRVLVRRMPRTVSRSR